MRKPPIEDCIIHLAKYLKIPELELVQALIDSLENINDERDELLDDLYWEFHEDNQSPDLKYK